ncbi:MAG: hypothetical protein LBT22_06610 [Peptococcaceae bacterium]|jgi:hypothetical protein|nr:hypothetical protein [Peptococcaceae bacterium]
MSNNFARALIKAVKAYGIGLAILVAVILCIGAGLNSTEDVSRAEQERMLNNSIRRAVIACYAIEGRYPESIAYMVEKYGVRIDETKFKVYYYAFASNIMPDYDVMTTS